VLPLPGDYTARPLNESIPRFRIGFVSKFKTYSNNEKRHADRSAHAIGTGQPPDRFYVASAQDDQWADPKGEFLGAKEAEPVWALFGKKGLGVSAMPAVNQPVGQTIGYHIRTGIHDITAYDWAQYLNFADRLLPTKK